MRRFLKRKMQRIGYILILLATSYVAVAQEKIVDNKFSVNTKLDLHSSHLWRGLKNGNTFSIQPTVSVEKSGFSLGAWAAYAGDDSYFEVDLFAEYSYKSVTFSLYDYYCPQATQMNGFLEFRKFHTRHTLDAMLSWSPEKIPFKIMASTFVLGDDISPKDGRQAYSTYIEPSIIWERKHFSGEFFIGYTPFPGYYAQKPSVINMGAGVNYNLNIGRFELPIQTKFSYNPILEAFWYSIGISISSKW